MGGFLDWVFKDALLLMIAILIMLINPKKEAESEKVQHVELQGQMVVTVGWEEGRDIDIDTWVKVPFDVPLSFQNKGTRYCNLMRDDTGTITYGEPGRIELDNMNAEMVMCRRIAPNELVLVNIHYYGAKGDDAHTRDIPVVWEIRINDHEEDNYTIVASGRTVLHKRGSEATLASFKLDEDGIPYGVSSDYVPLAKRPPK